MIEIKSEVMEESTVSEIKEEIELKPSIEEVRTDKVEVEIQPQKETEVKLDVEIEEETSVTEVKEEIELKPTIEEVPTEKVEVEMYGLRMHEEEQGKLLVVFFGYKILPCIFHFQK